MTSPDLARRRLALLDIEPSLAQHVVVELGHFGRGAPTA